MKLEHGSREKHVKVLKQAKKMGVSEIWRSDLIHPFRRENALFAEAEGFFTRVPDGQTEDPEKGFRIKWSDKEIV